MTIRFPPAVRRTLLRPFLSKNASRNKEKSWFKLVGMLKTFVPGATSVCQIVPCASSFPISSCRVFRRVQTSSPEIQHHILFKFTPHHSYPFLSKPQASCEVARFKYRCHVTTDLAKRVQPTPVADATLALSYSL